MSDTKAREIKDDNLYHSQYVTGTVAGTKFGLDVVQQLIKSDGSSSTALATENGALAVGNAVKKFRDGFASIAENAGPDSALWTEAFTNQGGTFRGRRGNAAGSSYMNISLCPLTAGSEYVIETVKSFKYPMRFMVGHSLSQRNLGQEFEISIVGVNSSGVVESLSTIPDMLISGSITVASNVATIDFATAHPYKGGDRILLKNNTDTRMNVGPVLVTVISPTQITIPLTIASATYTAGGSCEWVDAFEYAKNASGLIYESATDTQATFAVRRNGQNTRLLQAQTVGTTVATQGTTSAYSDAFHAASRSEFIFNQEESVLVSRVQDSNSAAIANLRFTQGIPDEENEYKIRIKAKNNSNLTRPIARIVSISKSGTTTATVTTDVPHNLTTSSYVQIFGVRDQTNFVNAATTVVASVIDATNFTLVLGSAVTATSNGGFVALMNGNLPMPGTGTTTASRSIQSISRTSNVLSVVVNSAYNTFVPIVGENYNIHGCDATSMGLYDGIYKLLRVSGSTLQFESVGADFGSINCGGCLLRRTDLRIHFISEIEYTRLVAELSNQNGAVDLVKALPVTIANAPNITTVGAAQISPPVVIADLSAAITSSGSTPAITVTAGANYAINFNVTAVSGTTPTMDVTVEESLDDGTNWLPVYQFPRFTAVGIQRSPIMTLMGNKIRYTATLSGTSPSFTRSANRNQMSTTGVNVHRQIFDRSVTLTTLNSTTAALFAEGADNLQLTINVGAITTTAPQLQLQVSEDGTNYVNVGSPLLAVASSTVLATVANISPKFARAIVTTAGVGVTAGYVQIKAY
jgi:hypothetical protein